MRTALQIFWEEFRTKYQGWFTLVVAVIAIGLWISMAFLPKEIPFEWAVGVSLACLVVILGMVLDHLIALRKPPVITKFHSSQSSAESDTLELITKEKVQLIEYSSRTVRRILERLKDVGAEIELLICNPNCTITNKKERSFHLLQPGNENFQKDERKDFQKTQRICPAIRNLYRFILEDYDKVKIKCYKVPGSIRGRNFGDRRVQLGWYTYHMRRDPIKFGLPQIWGDTNPVITAPVSSPEGQVLKSMFNEVFQKMWQKSDPLIDVCGKCSKKAGCFGSDEAAMEWLQLVSPHEEK